LEVLRLKARARFAYVVNGPSDEEAAAARVSHGLRLMDECVAEMSKLVRVDLAERRAELAKRSVHGTGCVITEEEALRLIAAKRQAAARPKRSRRTRARPVRREVF
jgi:hypothetical protein